MPVDVEHVNIQMVMGNKHTFYFSKSDKCENLWKRNTIISRFHCVLSFCHSFTFSGVVGLWQYCFCMICIRFLLAFV
jgi:hypothetical protein